jgi:predicted transcriptional regulator
MPAIMPARSQLTLRIDERLARHLKQVAADRGLSVNAFAEQALAAAVDPDAAGSEIERHRERLARAGLLATPAPVDFEPPSDEEFEAARRAAGKGKSLSDYIIEERDRER